MGPPRQEPVIVHELQQHDQIKLTHLAVWDRPHCRNERIEPVFAQCVAKSLFPHEFPNRLAAMSHWREQRLTRFVMKAILVIDQREERLRCEQ